MMTLTNYAKYEVPLDAWVAPATGDLVCPICGNFIKDVQEIIMNEQKNIVYIGAYRHSRMVDNPWYLAEDLALLCSEQCLDLHNTLGGLYA